MDTTTTPQRRAIIVAVIACAVVGVLFVGIAGWSAATALSRVGGDEVATPAPVAADDDSPFSDDTQEIIDALPDAPSAPERAEADELAFLTFTPTGSSVLCTSESMVFPVTVSWESQNAVAAWFGVDTPNAKAAPLQQVDPTGSFTWDFSCANAETTFTVTIEDASGALAHHSLVIERI